jgi:hypothetical protein
VNPDVDPVNDDAMTEAQRQKYNDRQRAYQFDRYRNDADFRAAHIERVKRCSTKKAASALTKEQLQRRRASDAARQARRRAALKAAATASP